MPKLKVVSMDFDSTISNSVHRWHMIDRTIANGPDFWLEYSLESYGDSEGPAFATAKYLTDMELPWIIVSGRSEGAREVSWKWLRERGLRPWGLYLCDERHDYMGHGEWKALRLKEIQDELDCDIVLHYDDISDVAEHTERIGIPTVLVHPIGAVTDHLG